MPSEFLPPVSPFSTETDSIEFTTSDSWSAYDLAAAMQALDDAYSTFLLTRHLAVITNERNQQFAELSERYWRRLDMGGPRFEMLFHEWWRIWRDMGPGAPPFFPFSPLGGSPQFEGATRTAEVELEYYLSHPGEYIRAQNELAVQKIQMASPGGFSLRGLGEPLRELRELIKDLWYRNRQERARGELEIIERKIALIAQLNLSAPTIKMLAVKMSDDTQDLKRLVENGKLGLPNETPAVEDKPKTARQRKPRRKPTDGQESN